MKFFRLQLYLKTFKGSLKFRRIFLIFQSNLKQLQFFVLASVLPSTRIYNFKFRVFKFTFSRMDFFYNIIRHISRLSYVIF